MTQNSQKKNELCEFQIEICTFGGEFSRWRESPLQTNLECHNSEKATDHFSPKGGSDSYLIVESASFTENHAEQERGRFYSPRASQPSIRGVYLKTSHLPSASLGLKSVNAF